MSRVYPTAEEALIPGHDPLVMQLYAAPSAETQGVVVRLDVPPADGLGEAQS